MERSVACGGFAIEFYLLKAGYVEYFDLLEISNIVFSNAWRDRLDFAGRIVTEDKPFRLGRNRPAGKIRVKTGHFVNSYRGRDVQVGIASGFKSVG